MRGDIYLNGGLIRRSFIAHLERESSWLFAEKKGEPGVEGDGETAVAISMGETLDGGRFDDFNLF